MDKLNKVLNFYSDLDLEHNNQIFTQGQDTPANDDIPSHQSWWQKDQQFSSYGRNSQIILALTVIMTLKITNQYLHITLWPMMIQHHTQFGCKRFSSSEDIMQMNIY